LSVASLIARRQSADRRHMMSEEQRARYLPRMAKGDFLGAFSMVRAQCRLDISNISAAARQGRHGLPDQRQQSTGATFADGADF
jgi:alkylation response protein AidB-like acyl-CoA dehydrogenase